MTGKVGVARPLYTHSDTILRSFRFHCESAKDRASAPRPNRSNKAGKKDITCLRLLNNDSSLAPITIFAILFTAQLRSVRIANQSLFNADGLVHRKLVLRSIDSVRSVRQEGKFRCPSCYTTKRSQNFRMLLLGALIAVVAATKGTEEFSAAA